MTTHTAPQISTEDKIAARLIANMEKADTIREAGILTAREITAEALALGWPQRTIRSITAVVATVAADLVVKFMEEQAAGRA